MASVHDDDAPFAAPHRLLDGQLTTWLRRLGRRYASSRRPWALVTTALTIGAAVLVVGAFVLANRQFAFGLGAAAFAIVLAWLLRVREPR